MTSIALIFFVTWSAAWLLTRGAARLGLTERVFAGESQRKSSGVSVPVIGGIAILSALVVARILLGGVAAPSCYGPDGANSIGSFGLAEPWTWAALLCAFCVGFADDHFGFRPRTKLLGQALAGACLVVPMVISSGFSLEPVLWVLGAILAQNAINTFDNADGAATSLVAAALIVPAPLAAAAVAGFLPLNLFRSRDAHSGRHGRPLLGDAGSHLLGILVLINPVAWPVLCLPLLDLARVSIVRIRLGIAPWIGDRRHLAHRLELAGVARILVPVALLGIAAPTVLFAFLGANASLPQLGVSILLTTVLFALAVWRSANPDRATVPQSSLRQRVAARAHPVLHSLPEPTSVASRAQRERPRDVSSLVR